MKQKKLANIHLTINFNFTPEKRLREVTAKQLKVYRIIQSEIKRAGASPTIQKLAAKMGVSSFRTVTQYLEALERHGYISRAHFKQNGIKTLKP